MLLSRVTVTHDPHFLQWLHLSQHLLPDRFFTHFRVMIVIRLLGFFLVVLCLVINLTLGLFRWLLTRSVDCCLRWKHEYMRTDWLPLISINILNDLVVLFQSVIFLRSLFLFLFLFLFIFYLLLSLGILVVQSEIIHTLASLCHLIFAALTLFLSIGWKLEVFVSWNSAGSEVIITFLYFPRLKLRERAILVFGTLCSFRRRTTLFWHMRVQQKWIAYWKIEFLQVALALLCFELRFYFLETEAAAFCEGWTWFVWHLLTHITLIPPIIKSRLHPQRSWVLLAYLFLLLLLPDTRQGSGWYSTCWYLTPFCDFESEHTLVSKREIVMGVIFLVWLQTR